MRARANLGSRGARQIDRALGNVQTGDVAGDLQEALDRGEKPVNRGERRKLERLLKSPRTRA